MQPSTRYLTTEIQLAVNITRDGVFNDSINIKQTRTILLSFASPSCYLLKVLRSFAA